MTDPVGETSGVRVCALETSSRYAEVALLDPGGTCVSLACEGELSQGRDLIPCIRRLLESVGVDLEDVDLFAVDAGPGSYTGIRVGVTAAKVLAFALRKPVVPVNSFDAILRTVDVPDAACVAPVLDAKLGQVYAAVYRRAAGAELRFEPLLTDFVGTAGELASRLPPEAVIFGDGAERYGDALASFRRVESAWARPRAEAVARLGEVAFRQRGGHDPETLAPVYLRVSVAEQKLQARRNTERGSHAGTK